MKLLFQSNRLHKSVLTIWLLPLVLVAPQLLTQYALAGTLPEHQTVPPAPTLACLGSPNVPVP